MGQYITGELAQCKDINQILTESEVGSFIKEHGGPLETFRLLMVDTEEHNAKVLMALDLDQRAFLPHYLTYRTNSLTAEEVAQLETKFTQVPAQRNRRGLRVLVARAHRLRGYRLRGHG